MRQLPLTLTDQWPAKSLLNVCKFHPGRFISRGLLAASSVKSWIANFAAWEGWIRRFEPFVKNSSSPACLKVLITEKS